MPKWDFCAFSITKVNTTALIKSLFYASLLRSRFLPTLSFIRENLPDLQLTISQPSLSQVPLSLFSPIQCTSQLHQGPLSGDHPQPTGKPVSYSWHRVHQVSCEKFSDIFAQNTAQCWHFRSQSSNTYFASWMALTFKMMGTEPWNSRDLHLSSR